MLGIYEHADSTALLTSFVTLAVECQKAGHKPSWFDAESLAQRHSASRLEHLTMVSGAVPRRQPPFSLP